MIELRSKRLLQRMSALTLLEDTFHGAYMELAMYCRLDCSAAKCAISMLQAASRAVSNSRSYQRRTRLRQC